MRECMKLTDLILNHFICLVFDKFFFPANFLKIIFAAAQCLELNVGKPESDRDWVTGMA